jgi:antitoxin VapB
MSKTKTANLFRIGRSQAVRLPREFRFEGDEVRIRRVGKRVLLEPVVSDAREWFADLDRVKPGHFMKKGDRRQPRTTPARAFD